MNKINSNIPKIRNDKSCLKLLLISILLLVVGCYGVTAYLSNSFANSIKKVFKKTKVDKDYSQYDFIASDSTFYLKYPNEIELDKYGYISVQGTRFNSTEIKKISLIGIGMNDFEVNTFPFEILHFKNLEYLSLKMRGFKRLPEEIINLENLRTLDLQHSAVEELPINITKLKNLEEIILLYSKVNKLPKGIQQLRKLKYLHLGCTNFQTIPIELYEMHWLKRLILTNIKECEGDLDVGFYTKQDVDSLKRMLPKTQLFVKSTSK